LSGDGAHAAAAAGVLAADELHGRLIQSIVDVARAIFDARAASILLLDEATEELVFEGVAGEGSTTLIGHRFPAGTGIAGWVLATRQPLVLENVADDPRFSREAAESTGYVPNAMMAVPLLHEDRALGVLNVLDRAQGRAFNLAEMELLTLFGNQAAIALELRLRGRRASEALAGAGSDLGAVARFAAVFDALPAERREAGLRLLAELETLLAR
jgi:GAF domain-containing protein